MLAAFRNNLFTNVKNFIDKNTIYLKHEYEDEFKMLFIYSDEELKKLYFLREKMLEKNNEDVFESTIKLEQFLFDCYQAKLILKYIDFSEIQNSYLQPYCIQFKTYCEALANIANYYEMEKIPSWASLWYKKFEELASTYPQIINELQQLGMNLKELNTAFSIAKCFNDLETERMDLLNINDAILEDSLTSDSIFNQYDKSAYLLTDYFVTLLKTNHYFGSHTRLEELLLELNIADISQYTKVCTHLSKEYGKLKDLEAKINHISRPKFTPKKTKHKKKSMV